MAATYLMERTNYLNKEIEYLRNTKIVEYDIRHAGFTTLRYKKLLPSAIIDKLEKMPNKERNVYIGKQIRKYPKIGEELISTLVDVRKDFAVLNQIEEDDVLSIKRDALFLIKKSPEHLMILDMFEFRAKEEYTSYCYLNGKEFYYSGYTDKLTVKGVGSENEELQADYLLKDIKDIMKMAEKLMPDRMFAYLKKYRTKYLARELDKNTYRNLDNGDFMIEGYSMKTLPENLMDEVDIVYNYINYLVPLFRVLV